MNILENIASSLSGHVEKAILCVKKTGNSGEKSANTSLNAIDLQAKLASIEKNGMFSFNKQAESNAKTSGYHVLKVKYNPSSISIDSRAGSFIQPVPGGEGTNMISQITIPAQTYMSFEILFDAENHQDAFMAEKFTNLSAGAFVSDVAGIVKNVKDEGYSVKEEVEAMIGMLTQSETRQVVFYWSQMAFAGEVVSLDARYTMFNTIGNPIRAVVRVTIQESEKQMQGSNSYWNTAFDQLGKQGSKLDKVSNLMNFR